MKLLLLRKNVIGPHISKLQQLLTKNEGVTHFQLRFSSKYICQCEFFLQKQYKNASFGPTFSYYKVPHWVTPRGMVSG